MIAVDTNVLVHAHRPESARHEIALSALEGQWTVGRAWGLPWPCVQEFLAVVTSAKVYRTPTPPGVAVETVRSFLRVGARLLGESSAHLDVLERLLTTSRVTGSKVHDARIAAICLAHGVSELWTADRDFSYFPELQTRNPLVG